MDTPEVSITSPVPLWEGRGTESQDFRLLIIYTGGTFAMRAQGKSVGGGALVPTQGEFLCPLLLEPLKERRYPYPIDISFFNSTIDSATIHEGHWVALASFIFEHQKDYVSFVVLHGTDTMSYTAAALSFMLEGLALPVVLTGAQIPIGITGSDAEANFIGALEVASAKEDEAPPAPLLKEVGIFFGGKLWRGNRTSKYSTQGLQAYKSPNYPALAHVEKPKKGKEEKLNYVFHKEVLVEAPTRTQKGTNSY